MHRRTFLTSATAALLGLGALRARAADAPRPNIIFIMADDLGYADLGCYGQRRIHTPHIDRLATEGMRCTNWYAGASVCAPSRCVLMTGKHTGHGTVRGNHGDNAPPHDGQAGRIPLRADDVTVATVLQQAGYTTCAAGKWGLGEPGSTGLPNDHGFDEWLGYLNQDHAEFYYTDYLWKNGERYAIEANVDDAQGAYTGDLFAEFGLDFIRRNQDNPFFLYLPTTIPHKRFEVPDLGPYADAPWSDTEKIFAAMVTRLDNHVGQILDLLDELDLAKNTLVIFTSDNGSAVGWNGVFDSCGPLRDKKGAVYEGGIRVPFIARWPEHIAPGAVDDTPGYFADFLPMAAGLAGAAVPDGIDGVDMMPALLGAPNPAPDRFLYWEQVHGTPRKLAQAVRWKNWKAVRPGLDQPLALYNLTTDLGETTNLAPDHPNVVATIENYLATARTPSPYWPLDE